MSIEKKTPFAGQNDEQENTFKENEKNGMASAALSLAIIAVCVCFVPIFKTASLIFGAIAIIFAGILFDKRVCKGKAIASFALGIVSIIFALTFTIVMNEDVRVAVESDIDEFFYAEEEFWDEIGNKINDKSYEKSDRETSKKNHKEIEKLYPHLNDTAKSILANYLNVEIGSFDGAIGLQVNLENKGDKVDSFGVMIEALDSEGNIIAQEYINCFGLETGEIRYFEIFKNQSENMREMLEDATCRVANVYYIA